MSSSQRFYTKAALASLLLALFVIALATSGSEVVEPELSAQEQRSFAGEQAAPEFPEGLDWLNTQNPLTLAELKGKVVILDFWTYGCINCIHVIPQLKKLETKYADELVVIGVHSAKFEQEGETENIRNIILRYELEHPVINDSEFIMWRQYGVQAWPTFMVIDPVGNVAGFHAGEGIFDLFDTVVGSLVQEFDARGELDRTPLSFDLEEQAAPTPLLFPGKVLADAEGKRLFIADSNHNRIVITSLEGTVLDVVGAGEAGFSDGSFESAQLFRPQGLTLADENTLYVADTNNHAVRKIDLLTRRVDTVAGVGYQVYIDRVSGLGYTFGLNSPWDVLYHDGLVYIAMAGQHQLHVYDPATEEVRLFAGTGREELKDGPKLSGGLNQPSGLATDGKLLYFADSEASAIRTAELGGEGQLNTIVGTGLFDFGDVDGTGDEVRLQHPLAVQYADGLLYVADTYNSKIKRIDPALQSSETFLGQSKSGWADGSATQALFNEPGGLSLAANKLYIADTNNHVIRVADLDTQTVETLVLVDSVGLLTPNSDDEDYLGTLVKLEPQTLKPGEQVLTLNVALPEGYQFNDLAPFSMTWESSSASAVLGEEAEQTIVKPEMPLQIPVSLSEGETTLSADLVVYYCEYESVGLCLIDQVSLELPVTVSASGAGSLDVEHVIEAPLEIQRSF